jgi:PEP-CTERM motif
MAEFLVGAAMKLRGACLVLCLSCLLLTVIPSMAQTDLYDNGPSNGNIDAWTINFGFAVSDEFTLSQASTITGLQFTSWMFSGDVLETADFLITSDEMGGRTFFSGTVNFIQSGCVANQFGFNVCTETGSITGLNLNAGSYWLNMENAVVASGDPVYWDENDGPSPASETSEGSIPSESFTILGSASTGTTSTTGTTPEPASVMLFGSAVLGAAGILCRKFRRDQ